jgi:hypothetical protein
MSVDKKTERHGTGTIEYAHVCHPPGFWWSLFCATEGDTWKCDCAHVWYYRQVYGYTFARWIQ